jgi:hypothetical protein
MSSQVLGSLTAMMKARPALISLASSEAPCSRARLCKTSARSSSVSFLKVAGLFGRKQAMAPARPTVATPSTADEDFDQHCTCCREQHERDPKEASKRVC